MSKRNNILEKYSDMRMSMGNMIMDMWNRLGVNKLKLITKVIPDVNRYIWNLSYPDKSRIVVGFGIPWKLLIINFEAVLR